MRLKQQAPTAPKQKLSFVVYTDVGSLAHLSKECHSNAYDLTSSSSERIKVGDSFSRVMWNRQPFGYNRSLFIKGEGVEDEISFEEYRAQFYANDSSTMEVEEFPQIVQTDPVKRKLDFDETPYKAEHVDDMTINTRGAYNELSDMFGK